MTTHAQRPLIVTFVLSLVLFAALLWPLWRPLLMAAVIVGPLSGWHDRTADAFGGRRTISAAAFTVAIILLVLIPFALALFLVVQQALELAQFVARMLNEKGLAGILGPLPDDIEKWIRLRYEQMLRDGAAASASNLKIWSRTGWALGAIGGLLSSLSQLLFSLAMMLIAMFFLFRDGHHLVDWMRNKSPLPGDQLDALLEEFRGVSKSIIGGNIATGLVQAVVATIGYVISGVPSPFLIGLLTFFASFIPSVGTAIVAIPAVGLLVLLGRVWWALFLGLWIILLVGMIDNLLRPMLIRGSSSHLHGALIFFSLMGGILLFGAIGLVLGPLGLAFTLAMTNAIYRVRAKSA